MSFTERLKKAEEYHKWRKAQKDFEVKDCFESAYAYIQTTEIEQLQHDIAVRDKALELAKKGIKEFYCSDYCSGEDCENCSYKECWNIDFIKLAEEALKLEGK